MYMDLNKLVRDLNRILQLMEAERVPRPPVVHVYKVTRGPIIW